MPNRLELELARDAVKAALESPLGKSVEGHLLPLSTEAQTLLSKLPGAKDFAASTFSMSADLPHASTLFSKDAPHILSLPGGKSHAAETTVSTINYKGWSNSFEIKNGDASAVFVPQTGRIGSFKLAQGENVFWENKDLAGQMPGGSAEWKNFGGDKVWPAPQAKWEAFRKGAWPPPEEFDQMPVKVDVHADGITATSAVNSDFGMRLIRRLSLNDSTLNVTSTFEKVQGNPVDVSVWSVAQMRDPKFLAFPVHPTPDMPLGFNTQMGSGIPSFASRDGVGSFVRDLQQEHKIGMPSNSLVWGDTNSMLRMRAENPLTGTFPDGGSATEIYTNNQVPYIELETLGPLTRLSEGQKTSHQVQYQLFRTKEFSTDF